ncbi:transcriptional regulator GcvA [Phenylobacterium sp. LjRoot225]|uniref:transcriptional regulator GcvA n=1 Tax=Phenylobacterium sp. LjRoot225 TaxID=3342285 RepID=UPI003ECC7378
MTTSRLPLNALRTFEAAARFQSFLKAADELAVTPGAVSRQIKALETELGLRLFERFNRAVRLTAAGEQQAEGVRQGLAMMQTAVAEAQGARAGPLTVSVMHSLAARWLVPRLHDFQQRYPDIQVMIAASDLAADLVRDRIDIAIRYSVEPPPGLAATRLIATRMFPVCSPKLLQVQPLKEPRDLAQAHAQLLSDVYIMPTEATWRHWLDAAGAPEVDTTQGLQFSNIYLAIEAALAGRGVALAQEAMVVDDLAAGRLVRPFDVAISGPHSHWIVTLPEKAELPAIRRFRRWLIEQAKRDGLYPE